jgi:hypothetical protein
VSHIHVSHMRSMQAAVDLEMMHQAAVDLDV